MVPEYPPIAPRASGLSAYLPHHRFVVSIVTRNSRTKKPPHHADARKSSSHHWKRFERKLTEIAHTQQQEQSGTISASPLPTTMRKMEEDDRYPDIRQRHRLISRIAVLSFQRTPSHRGSASSRKFPRSCSRSVLYYPPPPPTANCRLAGCAINFS